MYITVYIIILPLRYFMILIWLSQASVNIIFFPDAKQVSSFQIPILRFCTVPTISSSVTKSLLEKMEFSEKFLLRSREIFRTMFQSTEFVI